MRESFIFYRSFFEAAKKLNQKEKSKLLESICDYALNGVEPELSGAADGMFMLLKPQLDANIRKYENGLKGGRPKGNQDESKAKPKGNQDESKAKGNYNDNDNVNENDNENGLGFEKPNDNSSSSFDMVSETAHRVIDHLNEISGSSYKVGTGTVNKISGLLDAGYTEDDIITVIDKKYFEWKDDDKMRPYLRPGTLFGPKFEEYFRAPVSLTLEKARENKLKTEELKKARDGKALKLDEIRGAIEQIREEGTQKERREEYNNLKEVEAYLEDSIKRIDERLEAS